MRSTTTLAALLVLPLFSFAGDGNENAGTETAPARKLKKPFAWDIGTQQGLVNYLGEMGGKELTRRDFVADMKLQETNYTGGFYARYKFSQYWSGKAGLNYVRLSGADSLSTNDARNARNLSFRNDVLEVQAQAQFVFYEVNDLGNSYNHRNYFRAYIGAGIGAIVHSPKTLYNGEWVKLRPLTTEGQDKPYSKVVAELPVSGGMYFTFNKKYRIGCDITWRTTFTDYLDDVSTSYAYGSELPNATAVALANRTDEKNGLDPAFALNFAPGNKRGDNTHNDSYLSTSLEFGYVIPGRSLWGKYIDRRSRPSGNPKWDKKVIRPPKW